MQATSKALTLQMLREKIGAIDGTLAKPCSKFSLLSEGLPLGSLVEVKGPGKTELTAQFLKEHPELRVAWVEPKLTLNPFALLQREIKLEQILFIEAPKEGRWALQQVLQSQCFQVIVVSGFEFDFRQLRRFQMLNERTQGHFFILTEEFHSSWVPQLQIEVQRKTDRILKITLHRQKSRGSHESTLSLL
jgi:hypothetical protein